MRKLSVLLSMIVMLALLLTACGGEETTTSVPSTNVPPVTVESTATEDMSGTQTPSGTEASGTAGVPVTGENNPSRVTNMMDFTVWNQNGEQVGEVDDFVLDLDNTRISYVVVGTGGFADLGEKTVLIPWNQLQLQTGAGDTTGGQQNAFILLADPEFLQNAPDTDINSVLPGMGQSAGDWDADIRNFWTTGQVPGGTGTDTGTQAANTPAAGETTAAPEMTATSGTGGATGNETATSSGTTGGTGTGTGTGTQGSGDKLQGVMLASEVIGSTITIGNGQGQGVGNGTGGASSTAMPDTTATTTTGTGTETTGTATTDMTATPSTGGTGTGNSGTGGTMTGTTATIEDMIVDTATGDIRYLVLNTPFEDGDRWIPVPLSLLRWDASTNGFLFVANANALQNAPFFSEDQFPDTSTTGWDTDFSTFWQNNGGSGSTDGTSSGGVADTTATPTP